MSSRLALDPSYPTEYLIVWGEKGKIEELKSYGDIQHTRSAFQDPTGNLLVLTNEILIRFADGSSNDDRERLLAQLDGRIVERNTEIWKFHVNAPEEDAPLLLAYQLSQESIVDYAEPNALQAATLHQFIPQNEPRFGNQWHLQNTGQNGGTIGAHVNALGAWTITTGSPNIAIVVHDSGVDINHPDLAANIGPGWDFDNSDNDATNNNGPHGTACAGVIAAAVNGQGVTGIAPGCRIIPLRAAGSHTWQEWADTFDWAAQHGRIISCSWTITPNNTLSAAIRRAVTNGVTVFCAVGNGGPGIGIGYPASMAETIGVGASTNQDVLAIYSQTGNGIDVVAPSSGGTLGIETTDIQGTNGYNTANSPAGDYCNANDGTGFGGTSSATPLTAGIAGLMLSVNPLLTPAEIRAILRATADKIDQPNANYDGNGLSTQYGFGRVNAAAAVRRARPVQRARSVKPSSFAVSHSPGVVEVFWVRPDGMVFTNARDPNINNGNWNNPINIVAPLPGSADPRSGVAAVSHSPGVVEVFWVRPDGMVFTNGRDPNINNGNWNNPIPIAPNPGSADPRSGVAAVSHSPGVVEVFWVRPGGMVFTNARDPNINNGNWNNPINNVAPLPGSADPRSGVAAVSHSPGVVEVFWVRPDGMVFTNARDPNINNGNWNNPINNVAPLPGSAAIRDV